MPTQFLARDGGRIAYDDTGGAGPLVIGLPGIGDRRRVYRRLTPKLVEAGYRVVTMDLRGGGESSSHWPDYSPLASGQDLLALLRHLGADRTPAVVLGISFSPAAAIWAAAEAPELIAGLGLISTWATEPRVNPVMRGLAGLVGRFPALWAWYYRSLHRTPPPDLPAYRTDLRRNLAEPGRMAAMRAMMWAPKAECNDRLPEVRCPVLVIMGRADRDFPDPEAEARTLAARTADAQVVMIDEAGHYPPAEQPDQVADALRPFLARTLRVDHAG